MEDKKRKLNINVDSAGKRTKNLYNVMRRNIKKKYNNNNNIL